MHYAVNVADMTQDSILSQFLLAPVIDKDQTIVNAEKTLDGGAVLLDVDEKQGEAIIFVIRKKWHKNKFRVYRSKTGRGGWKRADQPDQKVLEEKEIKEDGISS